MAVDVRTEIEIKRPRDEVSAFAADPANAPAWYKNIKTIAWQTSPPAVLGSRIRFRAQFLGRTLDDTYEVRELQPGRRFVMSTAQGPFPMETTYTWEDAPDGATRMSLAVAMAALARALRRLAHGIGGWTAHAPVGQGRPLAL